MPTPVDDIPGNPSFEHLTGLLRSARSRHPGGSAESFCGCAEWDGTDEAHPAFVRGEEKGYRAAVEAVRRALDGEEVETSDPAIRSVLERVAGILAGREKMRRTLQDAWSEIGGWIRLARYQRTLLNHSDPPCPSQTGIEAGEAVRRRISEVLNAIHEGRL
jgi:hypothetical protein